MKKKQRFQREMIDDVDALYAETLKAEIGDISEVTSQVPTSVYERDHAFVLMMQCVKVIALIDGVYHYRIKMSNLDHDTLLLLLTSLRVIFPSGEGKSLQRSRLRREMESLGIGHMGGWIKCHKDGSYTLEIPSVPSPLMRKTCKILFDW